MNAWQVVRQLKALLEDAAWNDGNAEPVFGAVVVTSRKVEEIAGRLRLPAAILRVIDAQADRDNPELVTQRLEVAMVARVAADPLGETVVIGGARSGGQGSSQGRGLLELEEEVLSAVRALDERHGVRLRALWGGAAAVLDIGGQVGYAATAAVRFEAWTTTARSYPAPTRLAATANGAGEVALTWELPPDRYDRLEVILRRAAGATAPASVTDGTGVTLASALATSVTDDPGAGTFSYAIFAGYDDALPWRGGSGGTSDRYSSSDTATVVAT